MRLTDEEVVSALLSERTNAAAAQKLGITERTLYQRMTKGAVKPMLEKAQRQLMEECISEMRRHLSGAADTIVEVMEDVTVAPQVRLNAADMLQRNFMKMTERADILDRLDRLEAML